MILLFRLHRSPLFSLLGAPPGQPDELFESADRQASIQQLSSEYFSLTHPSDAESLYETPSVEKTLIDHSSSEHESSEHSTGEHVSSEHSSGEQSSEHVSGEHVSSEHITGEHTSGEHTSGEHTSSEGSEQSSEQASEVSSAEQVSGEKTEEVGEQSAAEATSGEKNEQGMSTPFPSTSSGKSQWNGIRLRLEVEANPGYTVQQKPRQLTDQHHLQYGRKRGGEGEHVRNSVLEKQCKRIMNISQTALSKTLLLHSIREHSPGSMRP